MLFIMRNLKVIAPLVIALMLAAGSYNLGVRLTEATYERQLLEARVKQDSLVAQLDVAAKKIKKKKAIDVRTIYVEKDPTGCADTVVPDGLLDAIVGDQPSASKELR